LKGKEAGMPGSQWLLFSCFRSGNAGEELQEYGTGSTEIKPGMRLTTRKDLGTGPAFALGARGIMQLSEKALNPQVCLLDPQGVIKSRYSAQKEIELSPGDQTLWYLLKW